MRKANSARDGHLAGRPTASSDLRKKVWRVVAGCSTLAVGPDANRSEEASMALQGKKALVTGSSRGIGRGIALKLAESGAQVAIHYVQNEAAAKNTLA